MGMNPRAIGDSVKEAENVVRKLKADPRTVTDEDVVQALRVLPGHYFQTRGDVYMQAVRGAADWLGYESLLWELSELIRGWLKAKEIPAGRNVVLDAVAAIVLDRRLGKGRQNFVLILGERGGGDYGEVVGQVLDDADVSGHAVKALVRSRTPGYEAAVEKLVSDAKAAWIRSAARKYLALMEE
jgi:hypothetical protein